MKFLDQAKIYIKAGKVDLEHLVLEEKNILSLVVLTVGMVVMVDL